MKRRITAIVLCLLLLLTLVGHAEEEPRLVEGSATNGKQEVQFLYPETCAYLNEGKIGTFVYLDEDNYITLCVPKPGVTGVEDLHDVMGNVGEIIALSDDLQLSTVHGDTNHFMPDLDVVEIGINLSDGGNVVVCTFCPYGATEVYDLLLTVVSSMTDATLLEEWLTDEWIPYVTAQL